MFLLELIEYIHEHKGELTLSGVFLFFLRKIIIHEIKQLLQFGRDAELSWTRERVERLTGEHYVGPPSVLPKKAHQNLRKLFCLLLKAIRQGGPSRRRRTMPINKAIIVPILTTVALLIKLATGYQIPQEAVDSAVDILLQLISLAGIFMHPAQTQEVTVNGNPEPTTADQPRK
jgi:hypothetical protein